MNNITIAGIVGNSEVKYLQSGDAVLEFSVADSEGRDKPTIWWKCQLWGKRAESLGSFVQKGGKVTVTGRVSERSYTDKNGQEKKVMDVRVNDIALQGGGSSSEPVKSGNVTSKKSADIDAEDLPF
jgi:single-strand DNA-binding protein